MTDNINADVTLENSVIDGNKNELLYTLSDEFERDSRRYNRAFVEESEVGAL
ncbi:MAG: hypothetical protein IJ433_05115 [Ruminococcus sp.]|nr:hypothetical protein [Ruminococcus sp.]